jgi:hypothetical protein
MRKVVGVALLLHTVMLLAIADVKAATVYKVVKVAAAGFD